MAGESASLLDGLSVDERRAVLAATTRKRYARGEVLFHEGDRGDALHLVEKGHIAIRATTPLGDVATFTVLGPGDVFGEQALLSPNATRTATAVALEAVETRAIDRDDFERLRATHPDVDRFLLAVMAATVQRLSAHLMEALYVPAETRVLRRVAHLAAGYTHGSGPITIPLTQDDLASMAGIARATANRVLRAAQDDGILAIGRGRIDVLDLDALTRRAR